ncbi:MAG TPA: 1-deoxy-D-xylulose-5-phosphate reductoisomerase [Chthoniobacterales bacterium]
MKPRNVVVLGATGSIGRSAQRVARHLGERMRLVGLSSNQNAAGLAEAAREFNAAAVCLGDSEPVNGLPPGCRLLRGAEGLIELATLPEADLVLIAIVGTAGLRPALAAIEAGKDIAVASKEILVAAGEIVMAAAARRGVKVLPVDSEHNAIFQCLEGRDPASVKRLILTCSGGPFRHTPAAEFGAITPESALKHPTWQMGRKITIDSATLFNKGLEMLEARWLFDLPMQQVDVIIHPQSLIHSMVEFVDGSVLAQLSPSDMAFPIHYAVTWPERVPGAQQPLDFARLGSLEFFAPRWADFPALRLAREAGIRGGTLPAVLNAANEVAVEAFLDRKIPFPRIWELVEQVMQSAPPTDHPTLAEIETADATAREHARAALA